MGARPQPPPRIPADNTNTFVEVLQALQHSQQQMMEEIRQLKTDRTKEKGSQDDLEHAVEEILVGGVPQNTDQRFITMVDVVALLDLQKATAEHDKPPHSVGPDSQEATVALLGHQFVCHWCVNHQEDRGGIGQPVYYISRALKDAETRYSRAERACLTIVYASQRLRHYFLAYKVWLMTKSHAIKALLQQPILFSRISQWLLQLLQYDLRMRTPRTVKSQAIADLLAQFLGEEEFPLDDEVSGEVAMAEETGEQWVMKFDGSSTAQSGGVGVVLYHGEDEAVALSFKLEFPCSNNTTEYKGYLTGLATTLEMGVKHLRVLGDSNLVVCQANGSFSLKEPNLATYRAMTQKIEEKFSTFKIEHAPRNEYQFANSLAVLGSQIIFEGDSTRVEVSKRRESIIDTLREKFRREQCDGDWQIPIKEALVNEDDAAGLKVLKDYALVKGELYRIMPSGVLARCVRLEEA
nr:uncharacterized protein LOC111996840 [Quercus suber]